ncbi:hypothetical protein SGPA1_12130 [Streptomyces misionensis JCM 4497]
MWAWTCRRGRARFDGKTTEFDVNGQLRSAARARQLYGNLRRETGPRKQGKGGEARTESGFRRAVRVRGA